MLLLYIHDKPKKAVPTRQGLHGKGAIQRKEMVERSGKSMQNKETAQPGGEPVYSIRKNGVIYCQSSLVDCGYSADMLKELRAAGFELYKGDKKLWRARA